MSSPLYIQFSDDGQHIRKWSREPFDGGTPFSARPETHDYLEPLAEALAKGGFMATEPKPLVNFPRARLLVIGFEEADNADEAMLAVSQFLRAYRAASGPAQ